MNQMGRYNSTVLAYTEAPAQHDSGLRYVEGI